MRHRLFVIVEEPDWHQGPVDRSWPVVLVEAKRVELSAHVFSLARVQVSAVMFTVGAAP